MASSAMLHTAIVLAALFCCASGQAELAATAASVASGASVELPATVTFTPPEPEDAGLAAAATPVIPGPSRPPRLFALTSPLKPFGANTAVSVAAATAAAAAAGTTPSSAVIKGVNLARHLYGSASAARAAAAAAAAAGTDPAAAAAQASRPIGSACPSNKCSYYFSCYTKPVGGCGVKINYYSVQTLTPTVPTSPVMRTLKVVPFFYGSWTAAQKAIVTKFLYGMGGSKWMNTNAQCSDTAGSATSSLTYTGLAVDFGGAPSGTTLTDTQVENVVRSGVRTLTNTTSDVGGDADTIYLLLTGPDVTETTDDNSAAFCTAYCGWHAYYSNANGVNIKYIWAGNAITRCASSCISGSINAAKTPNGDLGVDGMLSVVAHEITEAASDPLLNAWYDRNGNENADLCAWQFGTVSTNSAGKKYNVQDAKGNYWLLQMNFSPKSGKCVIGI